MGLVGRHQCEADAFVCGAAGDFAGRLCLARSRMKGIGPAMPPGLSLTIRTATSDAKERLAGTAIRTMAASATAHASRRLRRAMQRLG